MKKTFLAILMAGCTCSLFAQEDSVKNRMMDSTTMNTNGTMNMNGNTMMSDTTRMMNNTLSTTSEYNAYSSFTATPPPYVGSYITRDYPAATNLHWRLDNNDWWHAYYLDNNNMPMHVFYNTGGNSYIVSLPVKQTYVPDMVVTKSVQLYGPVLYDINTIKGTNKEDIYAVRILENGNVSTVYMDENGNRVMDVYRMETTTENAALQPDTNTEMKMETDMNNTDMNTKTKVKTKNSDGTETKTKTKNGKTKTRTNGTQP